LFKFMMHLQYGVSRRSQLGGSGHAAPQTSASGEFYFDSAIGKWDQNAGSQLYLYGAVKDAVGCHSVESDIRGRADVIISRYVGGFGSFWARQKTLRS
jgi:predicted phage gp36 major capsid-like protein